MFDRKTQLRVLMLGIGVCLMPACAVLEHKREYEGDIDKYLGVAETVRYSEVVQDVDGKTIDQSNEGIPATVDSEPRQVYLLSVEEAVQNALTNSRILRDLGARLIRAPDSARSIMDPAIVETDPTTGIEAALSEFDVSLASSLFFENNDFAANNLFQLQGSDTFKQDFLVYQLELSKRTATGTEFAIRNNTDYDANNSPANLFPSAWNTNVEAEVRHPLLQGNGVAFNRVAGPNGTPKNFNGVVLARLDTDVSQIDFEIAVRDLINNVENAYWDLYFAYRHLDSRIKARNAAFDTLRTIEAKKESLDSNDVLLELANEQYWEFEEEVINAQSGRIVDGTRSNNGSQGGSFNANVGLQVAERRLRLLMGWPINDHRELRPQRDPAMVEVSFDWSSAIQEAQTGRAEIRKQQLKLKRRGLELAATRNFLLQRVDLVGLYRFRGFGQRLIRSSPDFNRFDNAYSDLMSGDFQEWRVGIETALPIGFRQAHSAVRSAQLKYSREQAILDELARDVIHNLSNEYANVRRAFKTLQINYNRKHAAYNRVKILKGKAKDDLPVNFRELLTAQRRSADADSKFFRSLVEYILAIKNMHFEKGSLLQYNNIYLAEHSPSELFEQNHRRMFESSTLPTKQFSPAPLSNPSPSPQLQMPESQDIAPRNQETPDIGRPLHSTPSNQLPTDNRSTHFAISKRATFAKPNRGIERRAGKTEIGSNGSGQMGVGAARAGTNREGIKPRKFTPMEPQPVDRMKLPSGDVPAPNRSAGFQSARNQPSQNQPAGYQRGSEARTRTSSIDLLLAPTSFDRQKPEARSNRMIPPSAFDEVETIKLDWD